MKRRGMPRATAVSVAALACGKRAAVTKGYFPVLVAEVT
jgi:hypothetical protein